MSDDTSTGGSDLVKLLCDECDEDAFRLFLARDVAEFIGFDVDAVECANCGERYEVGGGQDV